MHKQHEHERIRYPCDQCDYVATLQSSLNTHKKSKHEGIRYPCDQCEYVATLQTNLITHKQYKHEGIRYPCDQCDYASTTSSSLKQHKQSKHEGIKYPCDHCDHAATSFGNLQRHKQSKHEGIMHPCDQCDYVATQQGNLKVHMKRKHKGQLCDKTIVKEKHVKVMIEKLDCSKYLKHLNSAESSELSEFIEQCHKKDISNSMEPEFIEISGMDIADTEIKIEDDIDPLSTKDFDFDGKVKNEPQNEHEQCTTSNTSAVETEIKQEENIEDPLSIIDTESNCSYNEHENTEIKTDNTEIKLEIT